MTEHAVMAVLTTKKIPFFQDAMNGKYTIHLKSGGMVDRADMTAPWTVISLNRKFFAPVANHSELEVALDLLYKEHEQL